MPQSKESSRVFSVEAVALPNLPQTFRGRERSKKGYASHPLLVGRCSGSREAVAREGRFGLRQERAPGPHGLHADCSLQSAYAHNDIVTIS